eukprot:TRINITY_DN19271_c0_g1_i1.p1 TRINITY_DN19271_c0_g1~~TRINITY_DN19271_c0_g1_i1.p1  ORF type:complete len:468 (-),score=38.15 TRINITY_DN19271_c0_g1_i1:701-2104(-)
MIPSQACFQRFCKNLFRQKTKQQQLFYKQQRFGTKEALKMYLKDNDTNLQAPLLSVAPMMDCTDVHYRQLARLLTKRTQLWTEMVVDKTIIHTDQLDRFLWFPPEQHPIVCQIGGSNPKELAQAAKKVAEYGYDEINLNCGCPSDRVAGAGCFGARLMLQPELVGECMAAIADAVNLQVTVKCRLGVDDKDSYADVCRFIHTVSSMSPVTHFVIHCRKCFLQGLNPHQNRTIPPLRHEWAFALKRDFPHLNFSMNGGILHPHQVNQILDIKSDGSDKSLIHSVMIGRAAYGDPWGCLSEADTLIFGEQGNVAQSRRQVVQDYCQYADAMIGKWHVADNGKQYPSIRSMVTPLLNLFFGVRNAKFWKRVVDEKLQSKPSTVSEVAFDTLSVFDDEVLDQPPGGSNVSDFKKFVYGELPPPIQLKEVLVNELYGMELGRIKRQKMDDKYEEWTDMGSALSSPVEVLGNS